MAEHAGGGNRRGTRAGFGSLRKLPSGRWQARYLALDGQTYSAGETFRNKTDAAAFLVRVRRAIDDKTWTAPGYVAPEPEAPITFARYSTDWLATRKLAARTRDQYASKLRVRILPTFGATALRDITTDDVGAWYAAQRADQPTAKAHAYALLKGILATAVDAGLIPTNPCKVRGGAQRERAKEPELASPADLRRLVEAMAEHHRLAVLLGAWCSLRIGEVIGLQRADVDVDHAVLHVRRSIGRAKGGREVKSPKSRAGVRTVTIPPNVLPAMVEHLERHAASGRTGWLFPGQGGLNVSPDTLREAFDLARGKVGLEHVTFHSLRGTGATMAARAGATTRELQDRLGHSTAAMALQYQRVGKDRPREIAERMAALDAT